jgi:lipopolysaccharide transport system permease protein
MGSHSRARSIAVPESERTLTIEPGRTGAHYWRDVWRHRELLLFLAWRDVLVRYKQTAIGVVWAVLRPLLTVLVLSIVFGRLAGLSSGEVPYPLFVLAGVLPWQFFSTGLVDSSNSLIANTNLLSKVYFPRLVAPLSAVLVAAVDFAISLVILAALMAWYGHAPDWRVLTLPLFAAQAFLACLGPGVWLAALNVKYRDFRYVVPFLVQVGLYVSPVGFASDVVPMRWRLLYALNPMAGVIDGFRWALFGRTRFDWAAFTLSVASILLFMAIGITHFRRTERIFADVA